MIKYIFLSERNILEIKNEKFENIDEKVLNVQRRLIFKYIFFYAGGFLILLFFWYYLSSFGAVYQNTQKYLIKNTLLSFAISLIYPFIINILPAIFRIISLKDSKKNSSCMYKFSKALQFI